jgi:hypothetical protein
MPALALLGGVSARALGFASGLGAGGSAAAALFNFSIHTFTTGGNVGRFGPTITDLRNAYTSQTWAQNAQYFFEGRAQGYQVFRVPVDGIYEIEVAGARGQSSSTGLGNGLGAIVRGRFTLSQNALLEMVVGQLAGNAGSDNPSNSFAGGSGGSFVGIYNTSNPLIVAGGGGGTYSTLAMGSLSFSNGSTRRRGHVYTGYSPADYNSNMPAAGQGGYGYHGGGGGGFLSAGQPYPGNSGSAVMTTAGGGQQTTHGASFIGGSVDNAAGTWYATGGNATIVSSSGGFGGGGGGHSGNNTAGGGGGYTGGMGGQTSLGGSYGSGLGGGSYIDPAATDVATSDGQYDGSGTFNSQAITNLGSFRNGDGYIKIALISSFGGSGGSQIIAGNFASFVSSLPLRTGGTTGTITPVQAAAVGVTLTNSILYTTLSVSGDTRKYNALMLMSKSTGATATNSRSNTTGHNVGNMVVVGNGFSSPEAWVGSNDATALLFPNDRSYRAVMGAVGTTVELYWKRDPGVAITNVFNRLTETEGTDWTQNVSTKSFKQALDNVGYSQNKTNGPWGSGHYGPWGWDTSYSTPPNSSSLKFAVYGNAPAPGDDGIFIFERDDNLAYQPDDNVGLFVFYPDYPTTS